MIELLPLFKQLWLVWFMLLFIGIVAWAYWPSRRRMMDECASIPFRDGDSAPGQSK